MKKKIETINMVHTQQVVGMHYQQDATLENKAKVIIYLKGGPSFGDDGNSGLWPVAQKYNFDLFIPDYIGYCRSDGNFSFESCVETIYQAYDYLRAQYAQIILVGSSWGGAIAPFHELKRKLNIDTVILVKPVTDWVAQQNTSLKRGSMQRHDEEMRYAWLNMYRGYEKSEWAQIFGCNPDFDVAPYNPVDNTSLLKGRKVFVCHGKKDDVVDWRQSKRYVAKLLSNGVDVTALYDPNGSHSSEYTASALDASLKLL